MERLDFQEMRAQHKKAWPENGCREARDRIGGRTASGIEKRSPEGAGQDWLTPDVRASCSEPEARSNDLLRFPDTKRQSPEQPGPGPGPGMPADPGWMVALETASCSGQAPAGVTLEDL